MSTMMMVLNKACSSLGMEHCVQELNRAEAAQAAAANISESSGSEVEGEYDFTGGRLPGGARVLSSLHRSGGSYTPGGSDGDLRAAKRARFEVLSVVAVLVLCESVLACSLARTQGASRYRRH